MRRPAAAWLLIALCGIPVGCSAQHPQRQLGSSCVVGRVSDGDSIRCTDGRRVRLIGMDSPESQQRPFGPQAREALLRLLPLGTQVRLEPDAARVDQYGRELAYVWSDSTLVNERMVRDGWALVYTVPPNVKYADRLLQAQKEARARDAGLWAEHGFACSPSDFRLRRCFSPP